MAQPAENGDSAKRKKFWENSGNFLVDCWVLLLIFLIPDIFTHVFVRSVKCPKQRRVCFRFPELCYLYPCLTCTHAHGVWKTQSKFFWGHHTEIIRNSKSTRKKFSIATSVSSVSFKRYIAQKRLLVTPLLFYRIPFPHYEQFIAHFPATYGQYLE